MSPDNTSANRKDSIFSSMAPAPALIPSAAPAPRASLDPEAVAALKQKIEALEKNIVAQIEKKFSDNQKPAFAPPPPPPAVRQPVQDSLYRKIEDLEHRLSDFSSAATFSASQLKNIEESKASARREIEELLKVVREQQKYSELDHQMHDQLEKAWARVEEMERQLLQVYSTAAKKPPEAAQPAAEISAAVIKAIGAGLEARLKPLEAALQEMTASVEASRGVEARVKELSSGVDAKMAAFSAEINQLSVNAFAGKERLEDIIADMKADTRNYLREAFEEGNAVFVRHVDAAALDWRDRMDSMSKMMVGHMDEFSESQRREAGQIEQLDTRIKTDNELVRAAITAGHALMEKAMEARLKAAAEEMRAENARQLERVKEVFNLSTSNLSAMSGVTAGISGVENSVAEVLGGLKRLVGSLAPLNLEAILGVSGSILRKNFEAAAGMVSELEKQAALLAESRGRIEANMKRLQSGA